MSDKPSSFRLGKFLAIALAGVLAFFLYQTFIGGGHSEAPTLSAAAPSDAKIAWITHDEPVELEAFADPLGVTIFEFTANW